MDAYGFGGGGYTPEQLQALMQFAAGQGSFAEQDRDVQNQLAMADALRNRQRQQYATGAGAALGGMGDALNQYFGSRDVARAQAQGRAMQQARIEALRQLAAKFPGQQQGQAPFYLRPNEDFGGFSP